jgi:acyl-CoA thioesterase I
LNAEQKAKMLAGIKRWNANISKLGAQYSVSIVDLFAQGSQLTAHPEYVSGDGFHPSAAGYRQLANSFWTAIVG